jgi:hypothetical protein
MLLWLRCPRPGSWGIGHKVIVVIFCSNFSFALPLRFCLLIFFKGNRTHHFAHPSFPLVLYTVPDSHSPTDDPQVAFNLTEVLQHFEALPIPSSQSNIPELLCQTALK